MCRVLGVSRQGYVKYKKSLTKPDKDAELLDKIKALIATDEFNDRYGRRRLYEALISEGVDVSEPKVYRLCKKHGLLQKKNKPKGLTKQEKAAYKNDNLLKGDFTSETPNTKCVTDLTQLPTADGTLYISAIFDCFDNACIGLSMADNMKTPMVIESLNMAFKNTKLLPKSTTLHSDRGVQYTSQDFRKALAKLGITQSMSHAGSSCYGNAKCESMWARFKAEAIYNRYDTKSMSMESVKSLVFRYFMGYWNHRRICSAIGGISPMTKRTQYYQQLEAIAS